jgi:hypothetical protein
MRRAITAALEKQNSKPGGEAAYLLARNVWAEFSVEVVKRLDRFVQIAPVAKALDDLGTCPEERFLIRTLAAPILVLQGAAVVLERYREVIGCEIEIAELLGLAIPIRVLLFIWRGRGIPKGPVMSARSVFGNKSFHTGPLLPI